MERISIQEIAAILTEKNGLKKKDAERFATTMFELVKESLLSDRIVKIKGLGTFKIIDIESRASVNVNTGERVVIEGHSKITFTPDAAMKELVNKPFSQFETVVLNDGVEFDDPVTTEPEPEAETEQEAEEELTAEVPVAEEPAPVEEEPEPVAPLLEFFENEESAAPEETPEPAQNNNQEQVAVVEENMNQERYGRPNVALWLIGALLACSASFGGGYLLGSHRVEVLEPQEMDFVADSQDEDDATTEGVLAAPVADEPAKQAEAEAVAEPVEMPVAEPAKEPVVEPAKEPVREPVAEKTATTGATDAIAKKYEQMDVRVRTGAYRIIGTAEEVKAKAGETVGLISRRYLGPDMECYVEVYNNLDETAQLTAGQVVKIPKLELKKKKQTKK